MGSDELLGVPLTYILGSLIAWFCLVAVRRRWFHTLSHVPGPFLWSISGLHILYHQVIREGQVMHELPKLHTIYGPVVRIGPNEIHVTGAENFDKIFRVGSRFLKDKDFFGPMEGPIKTPVILTAISPDVHRARRVPLNPFFSRRAVLGLEGVIWDKVHKLASLVDKQLIKEPIQSFNMCRAIRAFSLDVVTEYSFARCWNHLDDKEFGHWYQESMRSLQVIFIFLQTFPVLIPIFGLLPDSLQTFILPYYKEWTSSLEKIESAVREVRHDLKMDIRPSQRTIFHELMEAGKPGANSQTRQGLSNIEVFADAINVIGAAAETTGATAERGIFEVVYNREVYQTLVEELRTAFPEPSQMNFAELEKLPYLTGVVKEALRLNPGIPGRSPRVVPAEGATFNGVTVPAGTVVSISATMIHQDEKLYPDPEKFDPLRWVGDSDTVRARERSMVAFGRGTRNCLGQTLALCEIYCSIAGLFYRFDSLELADGIGRQDMQVVELLLGYHRRAAKEFRITRAGG